MSKENSQKDDKELEKFDSYDFRDLTDEQKAKLEDYKKKLKDQLQASSK